jgi:hypothetical protein
MKALSVKQPWAWLIVNGHKDIENRDWKTSKRERILIHAGKEIDKNYWQIKKQVQEELGIEIPDWQDLDTGGIVGAVDIVDCVTESDSPWKHGESKFGIVLANAEVLPFRPFLGKLGFFEVPEEKTA